MILSCACCACASGSCCRRFRARASSSRARSSVRIVWYTWLTVATQALRRAARATALFFCASTVAQSVLRDSTVSLAFLSAQHCCLYDRCSTAKIPARMESSSTLTTFRSCVSVRCSKSNLCEGAQTMRRGCINSARRLRRAAAAGSQAGRCCPGPGPGQRTGRSGSRDRSPRTTASQSGRGTAGPA
jgi:hypothetical protein